MKISNLDLFAPLAIAAAAGVVGWAYVNMKPPPPKVCGTPGGPPVTSPRVKLSDGRHLAYKETGVSKEEAKYKIIFIHGFNSSKDVYLPISQDLIKELQIYVVLYDRAGYGDSDPHPKRSVKSEAFDIQELADTLQLGSKFYVVGASMGAYAAWSCLYYIPHRLAGVALVVPFVNYWWPCFPSSLAKEGFEKMLLSDQWVYRVAHHIPQLLYWWITQKWFPALAVLRGNMRIFCDQDLEILNKLSEVPSVGQEKIRQQGDYESLHRDIRVGLGKWEFDPLDVTNPFPDNEGSVHIWLGREDRLIPRLLNHYISQKLPWIKYHEIPDEGHFFIHTNSYCDAIFRELVRGQSLINVKFIGEIV